MAVTKPAATITIRNLDGNVKERLRMRAALNSRSMEAEARSILATALAWEDGTTTSLVDRIRRHVEPLGGIELGEHPPLVIGEPPSLG